MNKFETRIEIVPAQLGFYLVTPDLDESGKVNYLHYSPVVAWCVRVGLDQYNQVEIRYADAVTFDSCPVYYDCEVLKHPGGVYEVLGDKVLNTEKEVIEFFQEVTDGHQN